MHTYIHVHTRIQTRTNTVFIAFVPIHTGGKNTSDAALLMDLLQWALDNPTPSHVTIISGDHYYAKALSNLKSRGYNTMLIRPRDVAKSLLESVNYSLNWSDVALNKKIVA